MVSCAATRAPHGTGFAIALTFGAVFWALVWWAV